MAWLSENEMWEAFGARTLMHAAYGGSDFGECRATIDRIGDALDRDAWAREWSATATALRDQADASAAAGHEVSAREAYLRAATYFRTAYAPFFTPARDEWLTGNSAAEVAALQRAVALWDPLAEWLEIPFEGASLPGIFVRARGALSGEPRPTVVYTDGYDGTIGEMFVAHASAAYERGCNVLLYDGPGQGRALIRDGLTMRPDWETVVGAVVDFALRRHDVDPARIVLSGWSFGGFLAPRAAGREHRVAALVADPGQWDQRHNLVGRLPLTEEQRAAFPAIDPSALDPMAAFLDGPDADPLLQWRLRDRGMLVHGRSTLFDVLAEMTRFTVSDVAAEIACPTLLSTNDGDPTSAGALTLFDALTVERKTLVPFTTAEGAAGHCEGAGRRLYHQRVYDWLDETLAG
ncbi:alpha/beta fold hydrolase [Conexibacter sp. JD483]|uniref:alpha/beta hydrolase family protein n=1 Tax=unclassified Conexibacter TaxID=2627773 RepID=UPI002718FD6F|nr:MULTISPECIES: alpha/beta fold hydrolase [unclassified Conexibacter]MDO8186057.1 alpha/beta fold hydrolase [Conexibacter sp. CPCC 205706]MDO8199547.1 alpha/beta fold hydrolase [Conexibacter sp. CPCC 205762]MDR9372017.1 alpha/beta fold hydrolase [Conexibacter sp. JD483]